MIAHVMSPEFALFHLCAFIPLAVYGLVQLFKKVSGLLK